LTPLDPKSEFRRRLSEEERALYVIEESKRQPVRLPRDKQTKCRRG